LKSKGTGDRAASVRARLLNLARQRGEDFQITLRNYFFERFLYRLGRSPVRERFVLKGAMLCLGGLGRRTVVCEGLSVVVDRVTRSAIASADMKRRLPMTTLARRPVFNSW
jgi:hypothetical protein